MPLWKGWGVSVPWQLTQPPWNLNLLTMFRESFPALALCLSLLASTPVAAKDVAAVVPYPVQGKTAAEVYEYIKTKSPRAANNATFAFTMIATKTAKTEKLGGDGCRYTSFKTSAIFNFVIPRHPQPALLRAKTRSKWDAFTAYLQEHEQGHRIIWQKCFARYDAAAKALTAQDCKALDAIREKTFTAIKRECIQLDEDYDVVFRKEVLKHPFVAEALKRFNQKLGD
jgi:predicted secreted Zn-dependent protease